MTSVDGGTRCYQTESPFVDAASHAFTRAKDMKNSAEVDDRLDEAASTDSPKSKDSWPTSASNDVDVSSPKNKNRDDCQSDLPQSQETTTVERESHFTKDGSGVYDEEKMDVRWESSKAESQSGMEMIATVEVLKEEVSESPQCSTDSATGMESMDLQELSPEVPQKTEKQEVKTELSDDGDDDFGEFEEAECQFENPDERQLEPDDDEFGDFEEVVTSPEPTRNAIAAMEGISGGQSTADDALMKLKGRDYVSAAARTLGAITVGKCASTHVRNGAIGTKTMRFNSCSDSRLGIQLLYPRSIPAGFLRSSGMPVLVSSKIVAAEQTVLTKLGLYNMYKSSQFQSTNAEQDTTAESTHSFSRAETRSKNSASEIQSLNDDLSFDLDFLVQFSSQQHASGSVSSNKTGMESSLHEDFRQHSNLHDLFDGVVRSSQSSFVSQSSEFTDHVPDRSQNSVSGFTSQPHPQEPSLDESQWGVFMQSREEPATDIQKPVQASRFEESAVDEWNDFTTAAAPEVAAVVEPSNNENSIQEESGDDIFSGEWLDQLRSSHEAPETPMHCPAAAAGPSSANYPAESDWGTFTEAPCCQTDSHDVDPFHNLMPGLSENAQTHISQAPLIDASHRSLDQSLPSAAPKGFFDLDALDSLVMVNSTDSKKSDPSCSLLVMDESFLPEGSGSGGGGGGGGNGRESDDEWGFFQG